MIGNVRAWIGNVRKTRGKTYFEECLDRAEDGLTELYDQKFRVQVALAVVIGKIRNGVLTNANEISAELEVIEKVLNK